jgi:hypothetical protein
LKVDRSFIVPESEDEKAAIILQSIVSLAHDLGLVIVAEGIEDQAQVDRLVELQCDYGQGFFIGQPMTAKQVSESLTSVPYVKGHGRTAMSNLWERAAHEPTPVAVDKDFSVMAIDIAVSQKNSEWEMMKEVALAIQAEKSAALPPPGSSPMAPRFSKPLPVELPPPPVELPPMPEELPPMPEELPPVPEELSPMPVVEEKSAKKTKRKPAGKKKQVLNKEDPKPSSVS